MRLRSRPWWAAECCSRVWRSGGAGAAGVKERWWCSGGAAFDGRATPGGNGVVIGGGWEIRAAAPARACQWGRVSTWGRTARGERRPHTSQDSSKLVQDNYRPAQKVADVGVRARLRRKTLLAGCTTVRDSARRYIDVGLHNSVRRIVPGRASGGAALGARGGPCDEGDSPTALRPEPASRRASRAGRQFRDAVRFQSLSADSSRSVQRGVLLADEVDKSQSPER